MKKYPHFDTEGPLGLPMKDHQAKALESIIAALPEEDRHLVRCTKTRPPSEVLPGERADVSWISTEEIDLDKEIIIAKGMNDSHYRHNPIVTLQHCYYLPPVGRSLWRKRARDGEVVGIKAKTQYPVKPLDWADPWPADTAFSLVKAGLMNGKSIGFLRLKSHSPTPEEIKKEPNLTNVSRIIDEWLLLEYACAFLPCNQAALVEEVSKGGLTIPKELLSVLNLEEGIFAQLRTPTGGLISQPYTAEEEVINMIRRRLQPLNPQALVNDAIDRARGRI